MKTESKILKITFFLLLFTLFGCKTEKNNFVNRSYHNVTSYYNVYYNGEEAYTDGIKKINELYKDNYSLILPVFKYSDKEAARTVTSEMNRAIEKGAKCVQKHSITKKPKNKPGKKLSQKQKAFRNKKEFVIWIDDAYLLIGKANVVKGEYFSAIETFSFVIRQYEESPAKYEAYLWLARTYTEMGKFDKALDFIGKLEADKELVPKELKDDILLTKADISIRQGRDIDAIPYLKNAIVLSKKKKQRIRYQYLLAQLYQDNKMNQEAYKAYGLVIDGNPNYEMAFNAKINRASIYNLNSGDSKELEKQLYKMLKDDKNIEYQDQIYYALAKIAHLNGDVNSAIALYKKSTQVSKENTYQKSLSYLAVADIYFERPEYENANKYYDSTITYLDARHPDYADIKIKTDNLNVLVNNLVTISTEDSLQRVAAMDEFNRNLFIDNIITKIVEQEAQERLLEADRIRNLSYSEQQNSQYDRSSAKWYFYNPAMVGMGQGEFKTKWGERKNADDWRRKNKNVMEWGNSDGEDEASGDSTKMKLSNKTREYYLVYLPLTDSAIDKSNLRIEESYFNLVNIYLDKFSDSDKSIESYTTLLERFPETEHRLRSYYNMFKLYTVNKNTAKADYYKQKIIDEFPESDYAKILLDPEYYKTLSAMANRANFIYQATYKYFINGNCDEVKSNFEYIKTDFKENKLIPKFELLYSLCQGRDSDTNTFKAILTDYIDKYPNTEEAEYAGNVLNALDREFRVVKLAKLEDLKSEFGGDINDIELADSFDISMYNYTPNAPHFYVIVVNNQKANANEIAFKLSNFNIDYYSYMNFEVASELLSASYNIIKTSPFKNYKMVSNYYESVIIAGEVLEETDSDAYRTYIMTEDNYNVLLKDKNIARFQQFFEKNYSLPNK